MRIRSVLALGAALLPLCCFADAKAELKACYQKLDAAMKSKNIAGVLKLCTSDFTWTDDKGKSTGRSALEQQLKTQMAMMQTVETVTTKMVKVDLKGNQAVVRTDSVFQAMVKVSPDAKKPSRLKSVSTTEDTWVKSPKGWMLKKVKALKESLTLDGQVVKS